MLLQAKTVFAEATLKYSSKGALGDPRDRLLVRCGCKRLLNRLQGQSGAGVDDVVLVGSVAVPPGGRPGASVCRLEPAGDPAQQYTGRGRAEQERARLAAGEGADL